MLRVKLGFAGQYRVFGTRAVTHVGASLSCHSGCKVEMSLGAALRLLRDGEPGASRLFGGLARPAAPRRWLTG